MTRKSKKSKPNMGEIDEPKNEEPKTDEPYDGVFEPVEPSRRGGSRMDTDKIKELIDDAEKCIKANPDMDAEISLKRFNEIVGMNRTSVAGVPETLNGNDTIKEYLKEKGLKFGGNRPDKLVKVKTFNWVDKK